MENDLKRILLNKFLLSLNFNNLLLQYICKYFEKISFRASIHDFEIITAIQNNNTWRINLYKNETII